MYKWENPAILCALVMASLLTVWAGGRAGANDPDEESGAIYVTQMDRCQPQAALSDRMEQHKWQVISYKTKKLKGNMVGAISMINAPDLTIPLDVSGWHKIYIAYWHPAFLYNDDAIIKVRLSDQPAFRVFHEDGSADGKEFWQRDIADQNVVISGEENVRYRTYLREVLFDCADLTGRNLVIGKSNGILGKQMFFAYVKLVPMSAAEVAELQKDRNDNSTRKLAVTVDGASLFHLREMLSKEDILSVVEPFRNSDVCRVLWAVCYGAKTNYPTQVEGAFFRAEGSFPTLLDEAHRSGNFGLTPRHRGDKQIYDTLRAFQAQGTTAQQLAADHIHAMGKGIKFDLMFRMGILGNIPRRIDGRDIMTLHPEYRQMLRDGTVIDKASYAFPAVRQMMLDMIRESTTLIDADGVNLCFTRGPHLLWYEQPILDAFRAKYGEDARKVDPQDPRLLEVRAGFMTDFMRQARQVLDEVGSQKGKRLELSIWAWPHYQPVWLGQKPLEEGFDIKAWIKEGLLDSLVCKRDVDQEYLKLCNAHNCTYYQYPGGGALEESPETTSKMYKEGAKYFADWDTDFAHIHPETWAWQSRVGHRQEMENWNAEAHKIKSVGLRKVDGVDVSIDLERTVYSGG